MIYFCYFIFLFLILRLLVSLTNFLSFRFLPKNSEIKEFPLVSVLIPARNEEKNISFLLNQLCGFSYANLEIIVYNDNSSDQTAEVVNQFIQTNNKIKLLQGGELHSGWLGKNFACHQLAKEATGEFLLFLDADVNVKDGLIERALTHMQKYQLHLLSIFPKQFLNSFGEKISVPLMNWILLSLLPLILIRKSRNPAFSAANGQFMMFRSETYKNIQPHKLFRANKVEDIAIIKHFKGKKLKSDTLLGDKYIACRMYFNLSEAIEGFTKNIFEFFGSSKIITAFIGILTTIAPFILYFYLGIYIVAIYLLVSILIRVFVSLASKQSVFQNVFFMIPQQIVFLLIIIKGIVNHQKRELIWKGRNILQD